MNLHHLLNFDWVSRPASWIGLVTLIALEIVLGVDNIVFISILSNTLPREDRKRGRKLGITLAVLPRLILLLFLGFILGLSKPVFHLSFLPDPEHKGMPLGLSWQDMIVIAGGLFLLSNSTREIHHKLEGEEDETGEDGQPKPRKTVAFAAVMANIMGMNIIFSLDSIVTAIGIIPKDEVMVMMIAVIVATVIMAAIINRVSRFVEKHPTIKMLALSFLLLIGMTLIGEGFHVEIPKGYVYFAMGFSVFVELLNLRTRKPDAASVALRGRRLPPGAEEGAL